MERGDNCEICNKLLTDNDHMLRSAMDWSFTCEEHNKYACYPKLEVAKTAAGFEDFKLKDIKCDFCDTRLTPEQLSKVGQHTVNYVCDKHKDAETWLQIDIAKKWFEYKEKVNPNAEYEKDKKDFIDWRIKNHNTKI